MNLLSGTVIVLRSEKLFLLAEVAAEHIKIVAKPIFFLLDSDGYGRPRKAEARIGFVRTALDLQTVDNKLDLRVRFLLRKSAATPSGDARCNAGCAQGA